MSQTSLPQMPNTTPFRISRVVQAPRELVFRAFTETAHLERWWGPKGFTVSNARNDARPGGQFHYRISNPEGVVMWGKWEYIELVPPELLVMLSGFSDADGGLGRHPLAPEWPQRMYTRVRFEALPDNRTEIHIEWYAYDASATEQQVFDDNHASMTQGWTGTFEQLEAYLHTLAHA